MVFQILLNLMIALLWMLLNNDWSGSRFTMGILLGIAILLVLRKFRPEPFYLKRIWYPKAATSVYAGTDRFQLCGYPSYSPPEAGDPPRHFCL